MSPVSLFPPLHSAPDGTTRRRRSSFASSATSAVSRTRKRSQSAQPEGLGQQEAGGDVKDSVVHHLHRQFQSYSRLGDRKSDGSHISCSQSDKWLKQVREYRTVGIDHVLAWGAGKGD